MSNMISITIDDQKMQVPKNTTVLKAAREAGIDIPTLCYLEGINQIGSCRLCVVDVGARSLLAACTLVVEEDMVVKTNTAQIREARKLNMELILSNHDRECLSCPRNQTCELQKVSNELGIDDIWYEGEDIDFNYPLDYTSHALVRDPNKCILCRRCVAACEGVQGIGVIGPTERGFDTIVEPVFGKSIGDVNCINCGQCVQACPVGALTVADQTQQVWDALSDPDIHVVVQTAPAVRAALGESFGMPIGTRVTGKMVAALKRLGFDRVFDTDFAADLCIMEEGTELLHRLKDGGVLPMITSCSAGWIKYMEHNYHDFIPNMSTCRSPQQMMGAIMKSYYADMNDIDPKKIFSVAVMPCSAKKFEAQRPEMGDDVDVVITTREFARMIKEARLNFNKLPDAEFDPIFGDSTGAGVLFGTTGGVMEAALRTVYEVSTGKALDNVVFSEVRGMAGIREATIDLDGLSVKVAIAHGTKHAQKLLDAIRAGEKEYHFI
ncbi:MAG: [FeFe] hydrogenase, group A, partial [Clostridiales bacterium]|nr:[FeFe] hydrogenase, group A [Clostridiales bacterium]